jgi:hypothetical protein
MRVNDQTGALCYFLGRYHVDWFPKQLPLVLTFRLVKVVLEKVAGQHHDDTTVFTRLSDWSAAGL